MSPHNDQFFLEIIVQSSAPIMVVDQQSGHILFVNRAAADLYGYLQEEMVGLGRDRISADPHSSRKALEQNLPHTELVHHRKKDGTEFPVEIFRSFFDIDGKPTVALTIFNLTDRIRSTRELSELNHRWEVACEATSSGVWDWNLITGEIYRSPRWHQMLGYEVGEVPPNANVWNYLVHPDDQERVSENRRLHIEGKVPVHYSEHRLRCKNGSYRWMMVHGKALFDEKEVAHRMIGFVTDINAFVEARERLKKQNTDLHALYELSLAVIQAPDSDRSKTLALIPEYACRLMKTKHSTLCTLNLAGDKMLILYTSAPNYQNTRTFSRGEFLSGQAWESGKIQIRQDYSNWPSRWRDSDAVKIATAIAIPMKVGDLVVGVFSLAFEEPKEFTDNELHILQQFAAIGALIARASETDRRLDRLVSLSHRAAFLNMLVSGDPMNREDINNRALATGISLKGSYVAITVEPETVEPVKAAEASSVQSVWLPFLEVIQDELSPALVWERYAALNILYPIDRDCPDIKQYTLDAARRIRTVLQACLPEMRFSIGIGNFYKDILEIHRSFKEAREALDTGRRLGGDGLYHYLDIGIVQMLARMGPQGPIQAFVNNTIGRLLDYDRNRKGQFLPTLEMILTGKSLRAISEEMNVHQKTIVFRKMRIEEILNLPLDEGDVRLNLSIALKLHKVQQSIAAENPTEPTDKKKRKRRRRKGEPVMSDAASDRGEQP